jgi:hypothetical protein
MIKMIFKEVGSFAKDASLILIQTLFLKRMNALLKTMSTTPISVGNSTCRRYKTLFFDATDAVAE